MRNTTKPTWVSQVMWQLMHKGQVMWQNMQKGQIMWQITHKGQVVWQIVHKGQGNKGIGLRYQSSCFQSALIEQLPTLKGINKIGGTISCSLGCALELVSSGGKLLCCCICCALKRLLKVIDNLLSILRKLICALLDLISSL